MKFLCSLPDRTHFHSISSQAEGVWKWVDNASSLVKVRSPHPSPWGREWVILPQIENGKTDKSIYAARLTLRLFLPEMAEGEVARASIERERVKANFAYSDRQPIAFFAFPTEPRWWLTYSFYKE